MPAIFAIALALSLFLSGGGLPNGRAAKTKTIVFLGDSLTAGFGVEQSEAFPALIADKIRAAAAN